jgi:phage baseplate assembly protein W
MAKLEDVISNDWTLSLKSPSTLVQGVDAINQNILVILTTVPGSDPLRPEFGADIFRWLDQPVNVAMPNIIREAVNAIRTWEQRVEITKIQRRVENSQIFLNIVWRDVRSGQQSNTNLTYELA